MNLIFKVYNRNGNENEKVAVCRGIDDKEYTGEVIIPKEYNGATVTSIGYDAFYQSKIKSIYIPNTVVTIGSRAFFGCDELETVIFEENSELRTIEVNAFLGCEKLNIRLPDRVHIIERLAFSDCTCAVPNRCHVEYPNFWDCKLSTYKPDLPPLNPIEKDGGNAFRLNETGDGYIAETIKGDGNIIEVPEEFNGLPVVRLGYKVFSGNETEFQTYIPATVKSADYFPFYGCDDMGIAFYRGTMEEWKNMCIYTWFDVSCKDGVIKYNG